MQVSKMEEADKDADLRQPSINTEPRTLDESSIERATVSNLRISWILAWVEFFFQRNASACWSGVDCGLDWGS